MAVKHGLGTYGNAVGTVTPEDHKLAQAGLIVKDTTGKIRAGLFYTGTETIVSGKANMSYDVAAFTAALTRGASSGAVLLANDGVVNVVTTAAPGSNSRYDVVYVWQREYSLDGTDSEPVIGVVQGTAAASPSVPSLSAFPGAIELARILVPAGVTATNSGTTITQTAKFTAAAGGVVHFRNSTDRDAETGLAVGQLGEVSELLYVWGGSAWAAAAPEPPACALSKSADQSLTTSAAALTWDVEISDPNDMHSTSSNTSRIVAPVDGLYEVSANLFNSNGAGMGTVHGRLNGTTDIAGSQSRGNAASGVALSLATVFSVVLSAGDYVEVMVLHSTATGEIKGGTAANAAAVTVKRIGG